jgi:hypothetical protein
LFCLRSIAGLKREAGVGEEAVGVIEKVVVDRQFEVGWSWGGFARIATGGKDDQDDSSRCACE